MTPKSQRRRERRLNDPAFAERLRQSERERWLRIKADPVLWEAKRESIRRWRAVPANKHKMTKWRRARHRARMATDPAYAELCRAKQRSANEQYHSDPTHRERRNARARELRASERIERERAARKAEEDAKRSMAWSLALEDSRVRSL